MKEVREKIKKFFAGIGEVAEESIHKREEELRMRQWLEKRGKINEDDLVKRKKEEKGRQNHPGEVIEEAGKMPSGLEYKKGVRPKQ